MFFLFDIGATKTRCAVSSDGRRLKDFRIFSTPRKPQEGIKFLKNVSSRLSREKRFHVVAGGVASPLDPKKTRLLRPPNLPDWEGVSLKTELESVFHCPVFLENDTSLVGLGEATHGAGRGFKIVAYITVSTGVNGVRIVDKKIDQNAMGFEIGHQVIDANGPKCSTCRTRGHLEEYLSGAAFDRRYQKNPKNIHDVNIWNEAARWLALGLVNTVVYWSPDVMIVGGSMVTGKPAISLRRVRISFKKSLVIFPTLPSIRPSTLGETGGLWGALELL